jgi:hypothetical protein
MITSLNFRFMPRSEHLHCDCTVSTPPSPAVSLGVVVWSGELRESDWPFCISDRAGFEARRTLKGDDRKDSHCCLLSLSGQAIQSFCYSADLTSSNRT